MKLYLLFMMILISSSFADKETEEIDEACNCDHCNLTTKDNKKNNDSSNAITISKICARGRDLPDREFPSVCYMLCYNRCTRWTLSDSQIATAYRTNYYKLREGTCERT